MYLIRVEVCFRLGWVVGVVGVVWGGVISCLIRLCYSAHGGFS